MKRSKDKAPTINKGTINNSSGLTGLIEYIIKVNPKKVMRLIYESGNLPYNEREPLNKYLTRNSLSIIHEEGDEGIKKLLSIHPDKELILDLFASPLIEQPLNFADPITESPLKGIKELIGSEDDLFWGISKCRWVNIALILLIIYLFFLLSNQD